MPAESQVNAHRLGHLIATLAAVLAISATAACATSAASTTVRPSATAASSCGAARARDAVLTAGALTVRPLYAEVLRYVDDVTARPTAVRGDVWDRDVLAASSQLRDLFGPVNSYDAGILNSTRPADFRCVVADMEAADVGQQAMRALQQDASLLSGPATTVYLLPWPASTPFPELNAVTGYSGIGAFMLKLWEPAPSARTATTIAAQWARYIPAMVAHEELEVVRYDRIGFQTAYATLLAYMVTDGMADSFATAQTHLHLSWDDVLTAQQEQWIWRQIQPKLASGSLAEQDVVMFGDETQGLPPDTGYTIGFHIVQGYLARHPDTSFATLAGLDTQSIFAGSGYTG